MTLGDLALVLGLELPRVRDELGVLGVDAAALAALERGPRSRDDALKLAEILRPARGRAAA